MSSTLLTRTEGRAGFIEFNRPDSFNSFNREMALAMQAALDEFAADPEVRVIVITASGKAFCAGQDLKECITPELNPGFRTILEEHYLPILRRLRAIEKPIVAAVNGVAAGAGASIALACDIVVACESAAFAQAFCKIGLVPDCGGTWFLPRLVGLQKAAALMMLGEKVAAAEAERMGMIFRVFPDAEFAQGVSRLAASLAEAPTYALGLTKKLLSQSMTRDLESQVALECECQIAAGASHDYEEGVNAFLAKRRPEFQGR